MKVVGKTLTLTEAEMNQIRFALFNLNSPSKAQAAEIIEDWKLKLNRASNLMHPVPCPTTNVN